MIGPLGYRWYEVAVRHAPQLRRRHQFGVRNLGAWNSLSEAQRKLLNDEAVKMEDAWYADWPKIAKEEEDGLLAKGAQLTEIGATQKAKLADAWTAGVLDFTMPKSPKDIGELRDFAKSKGLLR